MQGHFFPFPEVTTHNYLIVFEAKLDNENKDFLGIKELG